MARRVFRKKLTFHKLRQDLIISIVYAANNIYIVSQTRVSMAEMSGDPWL